MESKTKPGSRRRLTGMLQEEEMPCRISYRKQPGRAAEDRRPFSVLRMVG